MINENGQITVMGQGVTVRYSPGLLPVDALNA